MRNRIQIAIAVATVLCGTSLSKARADEAKFTHAAAVPIKQSSSKIAVEKNLDSASDAEPAKVNLDLRTTPEYCLKSLNAVDELITKNLFSAAVAKNEWGKAKADHTKKILACKTIMELDSELNAAVAQMHLSHCQYLTTNDETYYYLNALFGEFNKKLFPRKMDYTGVICGGKTIPANQVRYILDGSPGEKAKLQVGDKILTVSGEPFVGQANFFATAAKKIPIVIDRNGQRVESTITPIFANPYKQYVNACETSTVTAVAPDGKRYAYIHLWAGGEDATNTFERMLAEQEKKSDGLILDLRDGYGGNSLPDLDFFYRNPAGYPLFVMTDRAGKSFGNLLYYDKPIVALINGGSRSGKELLAFSLKRTGRAKLVGEKTAGYVTGGRLFPIDDRSALYLAVTDCKIDNVRLEGNGVEPDIIVPNPGNTADGAKAQLDKAREVLFEQMSNGFNK